MRAELVARAADLGFEPFDFGFEGFDPILVLRRRRSLRSSEDEPGDLCAHLLQLIE